MKFFQNSVLQKHLKNQDAEAMKAAYGKFTAYFHNPEIQQNIRDAKEEQFQEGFLRELFVNVLGYTLNPSPNYNLTSELKNEKGAKKADGAILTRELALSSTKEPAPLHAPPYKVLAVIELKGTDTKDLDKINVQAFNYKNNQTGCVYVITSNFEKLRFFIHHSVDHLEFNLFTLTESEFQLLWLCLSAGNLLNGVPLKVKEDSLLEEEKVTKQLYKDYSAFRNDLWQNMVKNSPEADRLLLFKKTQKLLDRYLFILFAEDSGLLPPNSVSRILKRWELLKEEDAYKPLYKIFNQYFGYINTGRKGKNPEGDIFAYNGGLFLPDEVLDYVVIDDEILHHHVAKLTNYDFQSEIDVNILGHIFENSLNEIENITAELEGQEIDKSKSKRKKDGVFYTPKYITKYIVENTIGKLCDEKKTELEIVDEEYAKGRRNRKKETIKKLADNLQAYRNWLLQITICDPACGSGAFLNQALEFLMTEHAYIDELQAQLFGASIVFQDISNHILEQNIYGVDINEESVDIAKLSLWLRTAQRGRKLTTLNNNIKCGNSLIDDPAVAGDKAFNWQTEFPAVFQKKVKKAWHVTCATHNSRYSQRMFDNHVKLGEPVWLTAKEEMIVTQTIAEIVEKDGLNILAYNICGDHMHLLPVCEEEELPKIVQKIKSMSARACNIAAGRTIPRTQEHAPATDSTVSGTGTREHAPSSISPYSSTPSSSAPSSSTPSSISPSSSAPSSILPSEYILGEPEMEWVSDDGDSPGYRGTTQAHLWTQKFGRNPIRSDEQLWNTIAYIRNNRAKHGLSEGDDGACSIVSLVEKICCSVEHAYRTEYKGGFDVVIGNPPYVRVQGLKEHYLESTKYYEANFRSATGNYDIYALFMEKSFSLISSKGIVSFILPHKFLVTDFGYGIRNLFIENLAVESLVHFGSDLVFSDAATYTCIINLTKTVKDRVRFIKIKPSDLFNKFSWDYMLYKNLSSNNWDLQSQKIFDVISKINIQPYRVEDVFDKIFVGLQTSLDEIYVIKGKAEGGRIKAYNSKYDYSFEIEEEFVKPFIKGNQISRNCSPIISNYVIFPYLLSKDNVQPMSEEFIIQNFPLGYKYIKKFEVEIKNRENGRMNVERDWFLYIYPKNLTKFHHPKIMTQEISLGCNMTYDENGFFYHPTTIYSFVKNTNFDVDEKYYLGILNSKIMWFFLKNTGTELGGGYFRFKTNYLKPFPLPHIADNAPIIIEKVNLQLSLNKELQELSQKFQRTVLRKFARELAPLLDLPGKLQNWYKLSYAEFISGLGKKKVKLSLSEEAEWEDYFIQEQQKVLAIKAAIDSADHEIDRMVYALYGLSEDEIKIVEQA